MRPRDGVICHWELVSPNDVGGEQFVQQRKARNEPGDVERGGGEKSQERPKIYDKRREHNLPSLVDPESVLRNSAI